MAPAGPFADLFSARPRGAAEARILRERLLPLAGTGVMATINEDGTPLQSRVAVFYDGQSYYLKMEAGAPDLDNLRRNPRLSLYIRDPLDVNNHIVVRGNATERRVQPSHDLVYVRIALHGANDATV
jgi:hypothetical protein